MARALGINSRLRLKTESVYGTAPAGNYHQVPFVEMDFNPEQKLIANDTIGNGRDPLDPGRDMVDVQHAFKIPLDVRDIGFWLVGLLGTDTITGTGPYTHTFTSGQASLPSRAIEAALPDITQFFMKTGAVLGSLKFPFQTSGMIDLDGTLIAQNDTPAGSTGAGTPTTQVFQRFSSFEGSIALNTTPLGNIVSGDVTYDNGLEAAKVIRSDGLIAGADPTMAKATGKLSARFQDLTLLDDALNGTAVRLDFAYTIDSNNSLTITLPRVFLPRPKNSIKGPGGVLVDFDYQAAFDSGAGHMMQIALINDVATAYT